MFEEQHVDRHPGDLFMNSPLPTTLFPLWDIYVGDEQVQLEPADIQPNLIIYFFNFDSEVTAVAKILLGLHSHSNG